MKTPKILNSQSSLLEEGDEEAQLRGEVLNATTEEAGGGQEEEEHGPPTTDHGDETAEGGEDVEPSAAPTTAQLRGEVQ